MEGRTLSSMEGEDVELVKFKMVELEQERQETYSHIQLLEGQIMEMREDSQGKDQQLLDIRKETEMAKQERHKIQSIMQNDMLSKECEYIQSAVGTGYQGNPGPEGPV